MKIIYCLKSLKIYGGLEKVIIDRANYLSNKFNYEIVFVTTDQGNNSIAFPLSPKIKVIDLNINFSEIQNNKLNKYLKLFIKFIKYKDKIKKIILKEKPNFVVSLGAEDKIILPFLKKNYILIREIHLAKKKYLEVTGNIFFFHKYIFYAIGNLLIKKYDKVILLTEEDRKIRRIKKDAIVIPNPININIPASSNCENKKIISVGRLERQKGYDLLINVWKRLADKFPEWKVEIYGEGSEKEKLQNKIKKAKLEDRFYLKGTTDNIQEKYIQSSIYVMSSRYEGFGLVLIEAMNCGLPVISFKCKSGPSEIITDNVDGFLCEEENVIEMANKIEELIVNEEKRKQFGKNAKKNIQRYSQDKIMNQWKELFEELVRNK